MCVVQLAVESSDLAALAQSLTGGDFNIAQTTSYSGLYRTPKNRSSCCRTKPMPSARNFTRG